MNDNDALGNGPPEQNIFPDAFTEPEGALLRAVFRDAPFVSRLARAPGGWRTLSKHEIDALELTVEEEEAVLALQVLTQRGYPELPKREITCSKMVTGIYGHRLGGLAHEVMVALALDGKNHILQEVEIAKGGLHRLSVAPRDVLRPLIRAGASAFILIHNHPSGDPMPSEPDLHLTRVVAECATAIGVPMVDHVIIGARGGGYASLLDLGVIEQVT